MATQRLTIAKVGGRSAQLVAGKFQDWQQKSTTDRAPSEISAAVDGFAEHLRNYAHCPPIVYFAEWIDQWSMGDLVPGLGDNRAIVVAGNRFEACCHTLPISMRTTTINGQETQETQWLRSRIQEAENAWSDLLQEAVIIVIREPLGGLVTDEEVVESLGSTPPWLASQLNLK